MMNQKRHIHLPLPTSGNNFGSDLWRSLISTIMASHAFLKHLQALINTTRSAKALNLEFLLFTLLCSFITPFPTPQTHKEHTNVLDTS